jgi:hypothetical protein
MINNSTNINKTNNLSTQRVERKIDTWRWKSKSGWGLAQTCGGAKAVNGIPFLPA